MSQETENKRVSEQNLSNAKPTDDVSPSVKMDEMKAAEKGSLGGMNQPKGEKLAIIGCSDSREKAPWDEDGWDFVGVNNLFHHVPLDKFTNWFEIHYLSHDGKGNFLRRYKPEFRGQPVNDYVKMLGQLNFPVFVQTLDVPLTGRDDNGEAFADFTQTLRLPMPNAIPFNHLEYTDRFGRYFTNTISWELAWGIAAGYKHIGVWGVDMAVADEYREQRPSVEYFIGVARGLGIKVTLPAECDLLKTRFLYAFEESSEAAYDLKVASIRKNMLRRRNSEAETINQATIKMHQYDGAIGAVMEMAKIWD